MLLILCICLAPTGSRAETLDLTEARVIELALEQSLGVKIAETDSQLSETGIDQAKSIFDTFLSFEVDHLIDQSDRVTTIFGSDNRQTNWNLGVAKRLPIGTDAALEWINQRNTTDSIFATINPNFESVLSLSIVQPLLKNFGGMQDRGQVSVARKTYEATDARTQRQISETVFAILRDYWEWITFQNNVKVTRRSYSEAKRFEKISLEKEKFGLHESTDVLAAKANRYQMLNQLRRSETTRDNQRDRLKSQLNLDHGSTLKSSERVPFSKDEPDLDIPLSIAFERRADYQAAQTHLETRKIVVKLAKNRRWPELNLLASLALNGVDGGYGESLSEAASTDHPRFFIGGQFLHPLENRLARSEKNRAELEKARTLYQLKDLENSINQNVKEQWREVNNAIKTVQTNRTIERLQHDKWQEELKKYRTGRSTSDIVIRYQEDYLNAQRVTILSLFRYRMAVLGLELAQNTLIP